MLYGLFAAEIVLLVRDGCKVIITSKLNSALCKYNAWIQLVNV